MRRTAVLLTALGALAACAARSSEGETGADTGGSTSAATTSEPSTGSADDDGTGTAGPTMCEEFLDAIEPAPFTFSIQNGGDSPIFLGGPASCQPSYFAVASTTEPVGTWVGPHCAITCEDAMLGACGCTADCPLTTPIRLEPGGTFETEWHGMLLVPATLPPDCANADCGAMCSLLREAPTGVELELTIATIDPSECPAGGCTCTANADGWCMLEGFFAEGMPQVRPFTYVPGEGSVVVLP